MSRVQLALNVSDVDEAVEFYERLFATPVAKRRQGYATYLLSEAFKDLQKRGITLVEAQTMLTNTPATELYKKLGFAPVDHGLILRRGE